MHRPTHHPTHHPTPRAAPSHLEEATNPLTISLRDSSGSAVELEDMARLGVVLGMPALRSHNRKPTVRTRIRSRMIGALDTLGTLKVMTRDSPTLREGSDSELVW